MMKHRRKLSVPLALVVLAACQDTTPPVEPTAEPPADALAARSPHAPQEVAALFRQNSPDVMAMPRTVFAAHDEATNRLVFGVEDNAARAAVQAELVRRGIPATAYRVEIAEPIHLLKTSLQSEHRPTMGGLQIHFGGYVCTLGFNVDHPAGRSFITNSHCTDRQGTTGTTVYNQPLRSVSPVPIAIEADDPAYVRGGGCSAGKLCRRSDAARALYEARADSRLGAIAKTTGVNNSSLDVSGGPFTITAQDDNTTTFVSGTLVNKVGRTTGWTQGRVGPSCATINVSGTNLQLLCQTMVRDNGNRIVQGGDSGSPVFRITGGDNVELVGILWGGTTSGDQFVFSPLKNVQDELGAFSATAASGPGGPGDPVAPLVADFTYTCNNGPACQFTDASTGGPTAWSWNFGNGSVLTVQNPSVTYGAPGTYTVTLTASRDGASDTASRSITCRLQGPNLRCR